MRGEEIRHRSTHVSQFWIFGLSGFALLSAIGIQERLPALMILSLAILLWIAIYTGYTRWYIWIHAGYIHSVFESKKSGLPWETNLARFRNQFSPSPLEIRLIDMLLFAFLAIMDLCLLGTIVFENPGPMNFSYMVAGTLFSTSVIVAAIYSYILLAPANYGLFNENGDAVLITWNNEQIFPRPKSKSEFVEVYERYRHEIQHEDERIKERLNWFFLIQSGLLAAGGFLLGPELEGWPSWTLFGLCMFGGAVSIIAAYSVRAAADSGREYHKKIQELAQVPVSFSGVLNDFPHLSRTEKFIYDGYVIPRWLPPFTAVFWFSIGAVLLTQMMAFPSCGLSP